ncbi:EF-hand calcium-binding domain-containing protein 1 isoform X2 [Cyprinodon tularosa]|uniref:EF-hand calcium-binding domain-containing protein 1 isoform X2 n=1 Tax=Cyprinodon tularosa TaxID=77115 RepID=UPI0018E27BE4|nr:EF-hand calcium-binding domain-containing protein 1 isoform X2 [Cyprinodon tularosa]
MSAENRKEKKDQAETFSKKVERFTKTEIECLIKRFNALLAKQVSPSGAAHGLDKETFRGIMQTTFGINKPLMLDGVFRNFDEDRDGIVSVEEWIRGLSVLLRGTLDEKIKYCYEVYDLDGDKFITKEEIFNMLDGCFIKRPNEKDPKERVRDLVETSMKMMDHDCDGKLSYKDFQKSVRKDKLLLEAFGKCLPDPMSIEKFERLVFQEQQGQ